MDGMQLQWLLDPSLPVVHMFEVQLNTILERWVRGAKVQTPLIRPLPMAIEPDGAAAIEAAGAAAIEQGTGDVSGRALARGCPRGRPRGRPDRTSASIRRQANRRHTGVGTGVDDRKRSPGPSSSNSITTRASES